MYAYILFVLQYSVYVGVYSAASYLAIYNNIMLIVVHAWFVIFVCFDRDICIAN